MTCRFTVNMKWLKQVESKNEFQGANVFVGLKGIFRTQANIYNAALLRK